MLLLCALQLAEMNDYLAPNQSCIKPIIKPNSGAAAAAAAKAASEAAAPAAGGGARTRVVLEFGSNDAADLRFPGLQLPGSSAVDAPALAVAAAAPGGHFGQMKLDPVKKTATVSLADCLACSGCVTSAETVLITQQSTQEFMQVLQANEDALAAASARASADADAAVADDSGAAPAPSYRSVVVSISPQSLAAIALDMGLDALGCAKRLNTFFTRDLKCCALFDTTPALDIALLEAREEFVQRYMHSQHKLNTVAATGATAASSASVRAASASASDPAAATSSGGQTVVPSAASPLPILTSECPGWVGWQRATTVAKRAPHTASPCPPPQSTAPSDVTSRCGLCACLLFVLVDSAGVLRREDTGP